MNRYSDVALKIEEPDAGRAEVTGIFRVGDSENFAQAGVAFRSLYKASEFF